MQLDTTRVCSTPVNACGIAAALRVVSLDVCNVRIGKEAFDDALHLAAVDEVGVNHQIVGVEGTQRHLPEAHGVRDLVYAVVCGFGTFTHEDGVARVVRVIGGLVNVVKKDQRLAGLVMMVEMSITSVELNTPIDDALFTMPKK